jgi:leader peptidase (prepilin peptidase)/N-methyltransferase
MSDLSALPGWYWAVMGVILGGAFASFLGVVLERVPRGESIRGRSRCACGRQLAAHENIPVLGWLRVRGTTTCCDRPLPLSYLLGEILGAVALGAGGAAFGPVGIAIPGALAVAGVFLWSHSQRRSRALPPETGNGR